MGNHVAVVFPMSRYFNLCRDKDEVGSGSNVINVSKVNVWVTGRNPVFVVASIYQDLSRVVELSKVETFLA